MLRKITLRGKSRTLDLVSSRDGDIRFRLDGEDAAASAIEVMPRVWSVLLDGRSFEVRVISDNNGEVVVEINGERYPVTVEDPRRRRDRHGSARGEGRLSITAPMPGKIVRVLAAEGDEVPAGRGLVVIEAMKMQNEMKAPRDGRVVSIPVREGETVAASALLAVLE